MPARLSPRQAKALTSPCSASGPECASGCCFNGQCASGETCFGPQPRSIGAQCSASDRAQCPDSGCCFGGRCAAASVCFGGGAGGIGAGCSASTSDQCQSGCCVGGQCAAASVCFGGGGGGGGAAYAGPAGPLPNYVIRTCRQPNHIHLTFDDGPFAPWTHGVLDVLRRRGIKATFFTIGVNIYKPENVDAMRRAFAEGHCIGDHTFDHVPLVPLDYDRRRSELLGQANKIREITGAYPRLARYPTGWADQALIDLTNSLGMAAIGWNVDPRDFQYDPENYLNRARSDLDARGGYGCVAIVHDYKDSAPWVAEGIIDMALASGLTFVPADVCFGMPCYQ
ncbi:hypothetical protein DFJ74DRAFT_713347 [Hyaloraphidium curvatum]|nr:hypothetical protein DFJ74DRAFT_713347 [Hyaloraphidium curvatum]